MDKQAKIQELQYVVNILYYIMGLEGCNTREIQNELYPAIYSIERVMTEIENQEDENNN